ncbi:arginine--tRNA ligase [Blastopirellula marina]|uniref:Arginine--tRNA ligase n=1 Tax=Blastopirellula marina TaxID=124 RepID=A0A2S8FXJ9_9BACT|nr:MULTISPECIES: arginine--tRNA ligase [Pirellulaceae]PQO36902.1 arginine--tRNA ligase [Blastopirellula marina]RCS53617.1 arginine--tRNA ligase [Bremerella cremea]
MNILALLRARFKPVLQPLADDAGPLLEMIRPAGDPKFGDYQANFAMGLAKKLGKSPRDLATEVVAAVNVEDICETPEVAGPGFINLKLREEWIQQQLQNAKTDSRIGIEKVEAPRTYVVDYSSPNVAKPMHVGHIRSTVIGDALCRTLKFVGHSVISDNHLGDWGTQFGMIIYGYKHFADKDAYKAAPVPELSRIYREVRGLMDYFDAKKELPQLIEKLAERTAEYEAAKNAPEPADKAEAKKQKKEVGRFQSQIGDLNEAIESTKAKIAKTEDSPELKKLAEAHAEISTAVLQETVKLHEGDAENIALWKEFLPFCEDEIKRVYERLNVTFDHQLGESFYHDRLAAVVEDFERRGLAKESQGATCVFLDGFKAPMIIRKRDGAFLYSTTDLATIAYRMEHWKPDAILYVVDFRQGEHFDKLFAATRLWGYTDIELKHVSFGTVMGDDGKPFKTRSGDTVGLEGLLDEAVSRAYKVVSEGDERQPDGPKLDEAQRKQISETVGIAALKYGDLSQNRETDYTFSYDKMLALNGNTATYMQYAYARVQNIFRKGEVDIEALRSSGATITVEHPAERQLAMAILRFSEALDDVLLDYRPNYLTNYLFDQLAKSYSSFYDQCEVLSAGTEEQKNSRLLLCDLTARVIQQGLDLLGIQTVDKM